MSEPFSDIFAPPAPVLRILFGPQGEQLRFGPFAALVDTGADATLFPLLLLADASVPAFAEVRVRGQWGESHSAHLYLVDVEIEGVRLPNVYAVDDEQGEEIVLGRNVLNKLALFLDGPRQETTVLGETAARRLRTGRVS